MCLTLFDFPVQVVSNLPFLSFIFLLSKQLKKKMYIIQRKTLLLHSAALWYLLTMGTKDCDWSAWLSKVNTVASSRIRLAFIRRHRSLICSLKQILLKNLPKCYRNLHDMSSLMLPLVATKLSGGWSQVQWVQASSCNKFRKSSVHGSGPKETSSSLTSSILKHGKFTWNKVVPKLYLNCALIEAEVEIQFFRANCKMIEATDV